MKKYFPIVEIFGETELASHLKVNIDYELGGYSYATGRKSRRGYYVYVTPVTIKKHDTYNSESLIMFSGFKTLLKEVKRQSKSAVIEVEQLFTDESKFKALQVMVKHQLQSQYVIDFENPSEN